MKFFKRNNLFLPDEESDGNRIIKGKSQVGYSRRSMLGFLGLGALAPFVPPLLDMPMPKLFDQTYEPVFGEIIDGKMNIDSYLDKSSALLNMNSFGEMSFEFTMDTPFPKLGELVIGQVLEFDLGDFGKEVFEVEKMEFNQPIGKNVKVDIVCRKPSVHLARFSDLPITRNKV